MLILSFASVLALAFVEVNPTIDLAVAEEHVLAAQAAATDEIPATLLLGLARIESGSKFNPYSVSRKVVGQDKRSTGAWYSDDKPKGSYGNYCCGVTQATAKTWQACLDLRDLSEAYATTAASLTKWLRAARGDLKAALRGYGCGWKGLKGPCRKYDNRVLWQQKILERALEKKASS